MCYGIWNHCNNKGYVLKSDDVYLLWTRVCHDIATIQNIIKYNLLPTLALDVLAFGFIATIKVVRSYPKI